MERLFWPLFILLFFFFSGCEAQKKESLLSPDDFRQKLATTKGIQLVDVRTPEEFQSGHLANAKNIDFYSANFGKQILALDKAKPVLVYCKVGGRSAEAADLMRKKGFHQVIELEGGIMKWNAQGLPLSGKPSKNSNRFTSNDLQKLTNGTTPVLIDFYAPWCGPCKRMEPMLAKLKTQWAGKIQIERINVDEATDLCKTLKVESIPVFSFYVSGKEMERKEGEQSEEELKRWLGKWLQ